MRATINIGLNIGDGSRTLDPSKARAALLLAGVNILANAVLQSATEATLVAEIAPPLNPPQINLLAITLEQDAIAQKADGQPGELWGPRAAEWGPFNPQFFLTLNDAQQAA